MKYSILAVASLFVACASANEAVDLTAKRDAAIAAFAGKSKIIQSRGVIMNKLTKERLECLSIDGSTGAECQMVPAIKACDPEKCPEETPDCCNRRRRLTTEVIRANGQVTTTPYPSDGGTVYKSGQAFEFREDSSDANGIIKCFHFDLGDTGTNILETCKNIGYDAQNNIASVEMSLPDGTWTWWATSASSDATSKQTFTLTSEPIVERNSAAATVQKNNGAVETMVGEDAWDFGGQIQDASGRIYYSSFGVDYACSGTVIKDNKSGRSMIMTAGHCVWDDIDEVFGSNVIFIPNRDAHDYNLTGDDIHRQCSEDVCGCWTLSAGFVPAKWRDEPWPARLAYDWGLWVVDDVGSHQGDSCGSDALDEAVAEIEFAVGVDLTTEFTTALGYTLDKNPDLRYCADNVEYNQPTDGVDTFWVTGCGLGGGASGGPWLIDTDTSTGYGKIVSVNSWSYSTDEPGMGGPIIEATDARCLVNAAREADFAEIESRPDGEEGEFIDCYYRECVTAEELAANPRLRRRRLKVCDHTHEKTHEYKRY